jgi:hypothetical protein
MTKAVAKKVASPQPIPIKIVCSLCGEPWEEHPENATALDCIEILKAKKASHHCSHYCYHYHYPYQVTYTPSIYWWDNTSTTDTVQISNNTMDVTSASSLAQLMNYRA